MNKLRNKIRALENVSKTLEPSEQQRNELFEQVRNFSNRFLHNLSTAEAYSSNRARQELFSIGSEKKTIQEILEIYTKEVASKGITAASEGHLGFIPGGGIYTSALADYLADITNEYAGISFASPGAVAMELELLN